MNIVIKYNGKKHPISLESPTDIPNSIWQTLDVPIGCQKLFYKGKAIKESNLSDVPDGAYMFLIRSLDRFTEAEPEPPEPILIENKLHSRIDEIAEYIFDRPPRPPNSIVLNISVSDSDSESESDDEISNSEYKILTAIFILGGRHKYGENFNPSKLTVPELGMFRAHFQSFGYDFEISIEDSEKYTTYKITFTRFRQ
jgi:hypothetical protein